MSMKPPTRHACQHCDLSLLGTKATAGAPAKPYWVTFEKDEQGHARLGFHCSASPTGEHEPIPWEYDSSPWWWLLPRRWWPGNWNVGWPT